MGKWEITMNPVQEWGEEFEDGAVYGVTLRREPVPSSGAGADGDGTQPCSAYVQYRTCKVRRLKAATLDILVGELLDPRCQDPDYAGIFLSTYRTFTSPLELIKLLFKKDKAASDLDNSECQTSSPLSVLIQTWLEEYSEDLRDPPFHSPLRNLVEHLRSRAKFCSLARCAETLLQRFQAEETNPDGPCAWADVEREEEENSVEEAAEWERPAEQGDITDFSVTSIAEQLTRLDSSLFAKVVPYQCLGCVWSQRDKKENMSPTIRATITQFNAITNGVITSLLCWPVAGSSSPTQPRRPTSSPAQRARVIEKWIRVAQKCRQLKNFSSLRAILSALQSNAVYRLRRTWAAVSRESMATFDNLWETFPDENCVLTSREILLEDGGQQPAMDNTSPGPSKRCPVARQLSASCVVVPYLGTYLTVLTMLDTALPDIVDNLINFEKRRREFDILSQIRLLQMSCSQYNLPHHPKIHAWLQEHTQLTDQESYELSRGLEPPVDMCSPAAWNHRTISKKLSFLLTGDGSKKASGDQMSVCSSGSSGSEMEDLSSSNSACSIRLQTLSTSCQNVAEASSSSSSSSSSLECPATSSSSSSSQPDLSNPAPVPDADPGPKPASAPHHQRSISMTSLPVYNRQVADSCIVRVSVDLGTDNGNMYKSILLTSQDKTAQVIQRALEKHHLEERNHEDFTLAQVISQERELIIPDKANVFYAMSTSANYDFVLRPTPKGQKRPLAATSSLGRYSR